MYLELCLILLVGIMSWIEGPVSSRLPRYSRPAFTLKLHRDGGDGLWDVYVQEDSS